MDVARTLADARRDARLTQVELARRAGTSQSTLSAYESGAKTPSLGTLQRLLGAAGSRLAVQELPGTAAIEPERQRATSRTLVEVLALAEALPVKHDRVLSYPRLPNPEL